MHRFFKRLCSSKVFLGAPKPNNENNEPNTVQDDKPANVPDTTEPINYPAADDADNLSGAHSVEVLRTFRPQTPECESSTESPIQSPSNNKMESEATRSIASQNECSVNACSKKTQRYPNSGEMLRLAFSRLNGTQKKGISFRSIRHFLHNKYFKHDERLMKLRMRYIKTYMLNALANGSMTQVKGNGFNGTFRLNMQSKTFRAGNSIASSNQPGSSSNKSRTDLAIECNRRTSLTGVLKASQRRRATKVYPNGFQVPLKSNPSHQPRRSNLRN